MTTFSSCWNRFYPRHPRGWRRLYIFTHPRIKLFLSTPPSRVATLEEQQKQFGNVAFLSTPPSRVATHKGERVLTAREAFLSTPPSRVATDKERNESSIVLFLSTPPSRVATCRCWRCYHNADRFYPRHPRGWRRQHDYSRRERHEVSIHATLAGGDNASHGRCGNA